MKRNVLLLALASISFLSKPAAQVAISYFPFESALGLSTNTGRKYWIDGKVETNNYFNNFNIEISPKYNFRRGQWVNYYAGIGISFNPAYAFSDLTVINGSFIDIGARIKPLSKNKSLQLVFEVSPYVNRVFRSGNLRTRLGVAYQFSKKKKG